MILRPLSAFNCITIVHHTKSGIDASLQKVNNHIVKKFGGFSVTILCHCSYVGSQIDWGFIIFFSLGLYVKLLILKTESIKETWKIKRKKESINITVNKRREKIDTNLARRKMKQISAAPFSWNLPSIKSQNLVMSPWFTNTNTLLY